MSSILNVLVILISVGAANADPIIGGEVVQENDFISRSVVALVSTSAKSQSLCTASLVAKDLAITAAHCVKNETRVTHSQLTLVFGIDIRAANNTLRKVDRVEIPKEWKPTLNLNEDTSDVALLHFEGGLPAGYEISNLLPFNQTLTRGQDVVLAGYGINNARDNTGEGVLRKSYVSVQNPRYSPSEIQFDQRRGGGACHGDSGGPAYVMIEGHPYLFGITSRGAGECNQDAVYTLISSYAEWFKEAVRMIHTRK